MKKNETVNITPKPKILLAITNNPMPPINALCELIDNSIDAFSLAEELGKEIKEPWIKISLPKKADIQNRIGRILVEDNGLGLGPERAVDAVTAGYSGNNPFDRLGLFGMGFNISAGKLGRRTAFSTCRKEDTEVFSLTIDLPAMIESDEYNIPVERIPKASKDQSGTFLEISDWWAPGEQNHGFVQKLVNISKPNLREGIGRRYSTLLRKNLRIFVDNELCPAFYHCVWNQKRFVHHAKFGKINARQNLNQSLGIEKRCMNCWAIVDPDVNLCENCGEKDKIIDREKKITGWIGIQRFDSLTEFGLDLIRNGRAIRISEKDAFFTWTNSNGDQIKDYPIDVFGWGRIVGEFHLDHVPVDFLKVDFQRTSPEWADAMKILRGESCLQPRKRIAFGEPENDSLIYKLFQGYRKASPGHEGMYMGYWDKDSSRPKKISRSTEEEYYNKFKTRVPGFGPKDDKEWWKLVEQADKKPVEGLKECPGCPAQNTESAEQCHGCSYIYIAKNCTKCLKSIPKSNFSCIHCGADQYGEEGMPWACLYCGRKNNPPHESFCRKCNKPKGAVDIFDFDQLKENSDRTDGLSIDNLAIPLPGGESMSSIQLSTYLLRTPYRLERENMRIPACVKTFTSQMHVFIDQEHPAFNDFQDRYEDYISMEIARWIQDYHAKKVNESNRHLWAISSLYWSVHNSVWKDRVEINYQETLNQINEFFDKFGQELPMLLGDEAVQIYEDFDARVQSIIIKNMVENNIDVSKMDEIKESGEYLIYSPIESQVMIFEKYPGKFFDNNFWTDSYEKLDMPDPIVLEETKQGIVKKYALCLADLVSFLSYRNPGANYIQKVNQSLKLIAGNLVNR